MRCRWSGADGVRILNLLTQEGRHPHTTEPAGR